MRTFKKMPPYIKRVSIMEAKDALRKARRKVITNNSSDSAQLFDQNLLHTLRGYSESC